MRKILLFIALLFSFSLCKAQFPETFSDGDFTTNPSWTGDAALFKVNTSQQLQLNAGAVSDTASLSVPVTLEPEMEWSFWVKLAFAPSDNNLARIYLLSNQQELKGALNGYYIKLGENGANDAIELIRQSGNIHTVVCRGTEAFVAGSTNTIKLKVVRASGGNWSIFADQTGGNNFVFQASATDNTFTTGSFAGFYCKFTSSNSTKFFLDDFFAGPYVADVNPPNVLSVSATGSRHLVVTYNEAVESASATNFANYSVVPGDILPGNATVDPVSASSIHLLFNQDFTSDLAYSLKVSDVADLTGNKMNPAQFPFSWHQAKTYDVLINEIMADPSPPVNLPEAEYVELYNRSAFPVYLQNWTLYLGTTAKPLPKYSLPAGGYVILCDDGAKSLLEPYGPVIDFSSFSVTNGSGSITLKDNKGSVIHAVSYTDDWFLGSYKKDGGWSLELVDPMNPCGEASNWKVCSNETGGTPGTINSVNALNPDHIPPAISRVGVDDATHITVWFTEIVDSTDIKNPANYTIDNSIGNPAAVFTHSPDFKYAKLTLSSPLVSGVVYTLTSTNSIKDCAGNPLLTGTSARFAIPLTVAANDLVINELLYDPPAGCVDFVEIFNRSSKVLDLKELVLANYDTITQEISDYNEISQEPLLILPGEYFVLSTDSASIHRYYKTTNPKAFVNMESFPSMNNDAGVVAITNKSGLLIDVAAYNSSMQYPLLTSTDGVSLERINPERSAKDVTNWHSASEAAGYATPGYKNSQFGITVTNENEVTLSPDIFSPDNDGYNDNLIIAYSFGVPGNNASVTIYDASGRLIRNLVNHELCGTSGAFSWDGITNDKTKALIGRYIVFVEIFDMDGKVKHYKKSAVLGGKL